VVSSDGVDARNREPEKELRPDFILSGNLAGDASILSLGFEKLFFPKPVLTLSVKAGLGFNTEFQLFSSDPPDNYFILPHHVTCNFGRNRSYLELGAGGAWVTGNSNNYYLAYPILGYRYHPFKNPGFSFRVWVYYPFGQTINMDWDVIMLIPYGLSFGIAL
jgi:hypothetical protein